MDGENGGNPDRVPGEVGRHEGGLPVVDVNQIRSPVLVESARRELGRGRGKPAEAHVVVRPVAAGGVAIGIAGAVVELRTEQDVDRQTILGRSDPERTGGHFRQRGALADNLDMGELFDDVPVPGQQDPDVAPPPQGPGQGRRNSRETSHPDKIVHLRGYEKYFQEMPSYQP